MHEESLIIIHDPGMRPGIAVAGRKKGGGSMHGFYTLTGQLPLGQLPLGQLPLGTTTLGTTTP